MIDHVHPGDLPTWLQKVQEFGKPLVLDVREAHELAVARIQPSDSFEFIHIPMGVIPPRLGELDAQRPVACMCHHGGRSMQVAQYLERQGFKHVANITGGIDAWTTQVDSHIPRY